MRTRDQTIALLLGGLLFSNGCGKQSNAIDKTWTAQVPVGASNDGLAGWFTLDRYHNTLIGMKPLRDGSAQLLTLNLADNSWSDLPVGSVPNGYVWGAATLALQNRRILLAQGHAENEQLKMQFLTVTESEKVGLHVVSERTCVVDKESLHGDTGPNTTMNHLGYRYSPDLGPGVLNESEGYVPFSWHAQTTFGLNGVSNGPFVNGVFRSVDFGKTWEKENISAFDSLAPKMCGTKGHYYYFGIRYPIIGHGLWESRKQKAGSVWDDPRMITTTFANVYGRYDVAGEDGIVHVCWMDRRHNKWRFDPTGPPVENNDIYYRRRRDTDQEWGKEMLLSKGLLYCYAPTISAEGDNVVVVWAGIRIAEKQHTYMGPNDIYYVTSKDAGKTWPAPLRVTDGAKDGITAGMPQVALLNGVIHLLYTQGAQRTHTELSPGLTKLGQGAWPIYYTHRPFPN